MRVIISLGLSILIFLSTLSSINFYCEGDVFKGDENSIIDWSDDKRLTYATRQSEFSRVAVDSSDNIHIVWMDYRNENFDIYYSKLDRNGSISIDSLQLTTLTSQQELPDIALDSDDNVHIIWYDERGSHDEYFLWDVYYAKIDCDGNVIKSNLRLTYKNSESEYSMGEHPSICIDSEGNIHLVWTVIENGRSRIYYKKFDNDANVLINSTKLSDNSQANAYNPFIVLDSEKCTHITWSDERFGNAEIFYTKINSSAHPNDGSHANDSFPFTMIDDKRLTYTDYKSVNHGLAIDIYDNLHLTWYEGNGRGDEDIYYAKTDNNANLMIEKQLTSTSSKSLNPSIATDCFNVYIAWSDSKEEEYAEIYITKLNNNGNIMIDAERVTNTYERSYSPALVLDSEGSIHIVWHELIEGSFSNYEIFYKHGTQTLFNSTNPSIALDSNDNIHIVWSDDRDMNREIYYRKLSSKGETMISALRLTWSTADSDSPSIISDSDDNLHIIWEDNRTGNYEIYYKKVDNNGNTLINDARLSFSLGNSVHPSVDIDREDFIWIVWQNDDGNYNSVYCAKVNKNGELLIGPKQITPEGVNCFYPRICLDSENNAHAVYHSFSNWNNIYYSKINANGEILISHKGIVTEESDQAFPAIGSDVEDDIYIAWEDNRNGHSEIFLLSLNENGEPISDEKIIASNISSRAPFISIHNHTIYTAWEDNRDGNFEIYLTAELNDTTLLEERRVSFTLGDSLSPKLAVDSSGNVHMVWMDNSESFWRVYYEKISMQENKRPVAFIDFIEPSEAEYGQEITFSGHGEDDGFITEYEWSSSIQGFLSDRYAFKSTELSIGEHTIYFRVKDDKGEWSEPDTETLIVHKSNEKPRAFIDSITPNPAEEGQEINFAGHGKDDGSITEYEWVSDIDGFLSNESVFSTSLSVGIHDISFRVKDDDNEWSDAVHETLTINPMNKKPLAFIDSITPNPAFEGEEVNFSGHAIDDDGSVVEYEWYSSIDGILSVQPSFSTSNLSVGVHDIRFRAKDDDNEWSNEVNETLIIKEMKENMPPTAVIESVFPNPAIVGESVTFIGYGTDDGIIVGYGWDFDGGDFDAFENVTTFEYDDEGIYLVRFKVIDDDGAEGVDSMILRVINPSMSLNPNKIEVKGRVNKEISVLTNLVMFNLSVDVEVCISSDNKEYLVSIKVDGSMIKDGSIHLGSNGTYLIEIVSRFGMAGEYITEYNFTMSLNNRTIASESLKVRYVISKEESRYKLNWIWLVLVILIVIIALLVYMKRRLRRG